ncbi:MAG: hypothetical protein KatS3mg103_0635 [Phycisphaerales bacterium]|nr:MAG: hypothetical protein KatS3mg103_0635 [Phycisphaerales bacterium]
MPQHASRTWPARALANTSALCRPARAEEASITPRSSAISRRTMPGSSLCLARCLARAASIATATTPAGQARRRAAISATSGWGGSRRSASSGPLRA